MGQAADPDSITVADKINLPSAMNGSFIYICVSRYNQGSSQ